MKKKRFMGLLALASCVTLLTGCESDALFGLGGKWNQFTDWGKGLLGLKKEEKQEEQSEKEEKQDEEEAPVEPAKPTVSLNVYELPEVVLVGEELDLDEYVGVSGTNESFKVELDNASAQLAKVDGHKISVEAEGKVSFKITVADKSASRSFTAMEADRKAMVDAFSGIGNRYTCLELGQSGIDGAFLHAENYLETDKWDYDETTEEYIPGGFLSFGPKHSYAFTIEDEEIEVGEDVYSDSILQTYNGNWNVDFAKAALGESEYFEDPVFIISGKEAVNFAENSLLAVNGSWTFTLTSGGSATLTCSRVEFAAINIADEGDAPSYAAEALIFVSIEDEGEIVDEPVMEYVITADPEYTGDEALEAFLADPENVPVGADYAGQLNMKGLFGSALPYYKTASLSLDYGWYDTTNKEFVDAPADVADTVLEGAPEGSVMRLFSENAIINWGAQGPENGLVQNTVGEGDEAVKTVYDLSIGSQGYELDANSELNDVYEDEIFSLKALANEEIWDKELLVYKTVINIGTEESPVNGFVFDLNTYRDVALLDAICASDDNLSGLIGIFNKYEERLDLRSYFNGQLIYAPSAGFMSIRFELLWDDEISYVIDFSFMLTTYYDATVVSFLEYLFPAPVDPSQDPGQSGDPSQDPGQSGDPAQDPAQD